MSRRQQERELVAEVRTLKKRIKSLERENERLRKDIRTGKAFPELMEKEEVEVEAVPQKKSKPCPHCGSSDTKMMTLSVRGKDRDYVTCSDCGRRKRDG